MATSKDLVHYFAKAWKEKHGASFKISYAKDCTNFKRLQKIHSDKKLMAYIDFFFNDFDDAFASRSGFSLGCFLYVLNTVVAKYKDFHVKREQTKDHSEWERVEEARKRRP